MEAVTIRPAAPEDAYALLAIYAPYVRETAVTFEYEVPTPEEFAGRIRRILERYPYLAAQSGGEVLGYACAGPFKERAAYDWSVETTIYLRQDQHRSDRTGGSGNGALQPEGVRGTLHEGGLHGLCGKRPRRGQRGGAWDLRRKGRRPHHPQRRDIEKGTGGRTAFGV